MSKRTGCYIYLYLRSKSSKNGKAGSAYYIGKGKHRAGYYARAFDKRHNIHIPKDENNIVIIADGLSDDDARQAEMLLIYLHGRIDLGTGALRNLTDGGEGCEGRVVSEETRSKISKGHTGKRGAPWTEERRLATSLRYSGSGNPFYGKTHSEEALRKISETHTGKKQSAESVAKMLASRASSPAVREGIERGAQKRTGQVRSSETRRKIGDARRGHVTSPEAKEKMRQAKLGKPQSTEHIEKVRKAVTASWVIRKQKYPSTNGSRKS